jgi:hypothetical protein
MAAWSFGEVPFVGDPFGGLLRKAAHDEAELVIVQCDPARQEEILLNVRTGSQRWPIRRRSD